MQWLTKPLLRVNRLFQLPLKDNMTSLIFFPPGPGGGGGADSLFTML